MNPNGQDCKYYISYECAKDTKDHNVREILKESLSSHVVTRCEDNRWNAKVEKHIIVKYDIFLDHVIAGHESCQAH